MEENKLKEIFNKHVQGRINPDGKYLHFSGFKAAIDEYEAEKLKETCKWKYDGDDFYDTSCGYGGAWNPYNIIGTAWKYCQFCGKRIEVVG